MTQLKRLRLQGWKSIKDQTIEFGPLNLLLGANGSGKSNLLSFFSFMRDLIRGKQNLFIAVQGGAAACLHYGTTATSPFR